MIEQQKKVKNIPVCFIIPPSTFLADERVFPALGPLKVAAELKKNGNRVEVLDLTGYSNYEDIVASYASSSDIKTFALTATTPQIPAAVKVWQKLMQSPDATIILGGAHATLAHAGFMQDVRKGRSARGTAAFKQLEGMFNKIVVGDGEMSVFQAIDPDCKQQLINAGDKNSPLFMPKGTLENYEYPARDLIDLDSYKFFIDGKRSFSVMGQLGCPFECGFCGGRESHSLRMARFRSPSSVTREIEEVIKSAGQRGVQYRAVMFWDDELNISAVSLENLCRELIEMQHRLGFEMRFRGYVKAQLFTPSQAKLMYQAGFRQLMSGVESGSDKMLYTMNKKTTVAINTTCLNLAKEAGMKFKALMSIGHPGETEKTINESIEWALKTKPDDLDWTIITQYPGSPYFDLSVYDEDMKAWLYTEPKTGNKLWSRAIDYATEAEYYKGVPGDYTSYVWTPELSCEKLVELRDEAERVTRSQLGLATITNIAAIQFEHSMGQRLPSNVFKTLL